MIFGLVYIETVAMFPKAVAVGFLVCAFMMVLFVRNQISVDGIIYKVIVQYTCDLK